MPTLSFVLCSRNDHYGGNSAWRLQTTLNYLALQVESLGVEDEFDVIVSDWGSPTPLREVLELSPVAARITRFLEVSPELASKTQRDSPFAEVLANNAAIRRATGDFIGRIDQDTLVGASFLERFRAGVRASGSTCDRWSDAMLFVGRRSIPEPFARMTPPFAEVVQFVQRFGRYLPREGRLQSPWFDAPVGIVILSRDLWEMYRGYDERLLYWGFMETDLGLRVGKTRRVLDLEREIGVDFHHLGHTRAWFATTQRRMNPRREPDVEVPNGPDWGLDSIELSLREARPPAVIESHGASGVKGGLGVVGAEWVRQSLLSAARLGRRVIKGNRMERGA